MAGPTIKWKPMEWYSEQWRARKYHYSTLLTRGVPVTNNGSHSN